MATIHFTSNARPTLGIEVELGLVDNRTMALSSSYAELIKLIHEDQPAHIKPELMQCVVELNTGICDTVDQAQADLEEKICNVESAADQLDLSLTISTAGRTGRSRSRLASMARR